MRVYSYIVTHDSGFAPNPFHGFLTLACCKPLIRRTAQVGDWVVGLSLGAERIVFAMRVSERLTFEQYWADPRFAAKKPDVKAKQVMLRRGDNIYRPGDDGTLVQIPSAHANPDGTDNPKTRRHDLSGRFVLVADDFVYFGGHGPATPPELAFLGVGRGHRCQFTPEQVDAFLGWIAARPRGILGRPAMWPAPDETWRPPR